ncbi:MAG: hypothetical protein CL608_09035 [Anaerolineaceae bacterium]|nr:hypothetical protein [Anaerolineaceae bacterium]
MNHKLAVSTVFLILIWGLLVSCQADDSITASTETAVSTPQVELVMETAVPTTIGATLPSSTASSTPLPTPSATATATAVPTPSFSLTQREPTLAEIEEFLSLSPVLFFYPDRGLELIPLEDYFLEHDLSKHTEFFYQDVNGDEETDLILADMFPLFWENGFVIVMLWTGNQYGTPLMILDGAKYSPGLQVTFEDWTNDDIPEIIFDFKSDLGGTGVKQTTWTRYVIHCHIACEVIWWGVTGELLSASTIRKLLTTSIERNVDEMGKPNLTIETSSFSAPDFGGTGNGAKTIFTSTLAIYTWNGTLFEKADEQVIQPMYTVTEDSILSATNQSGIDARITSEFDNFYADYVIFHCTLEVGEIIVEETFECLPNFTKVTWLDITNDGREEIIIDATGLGTQSLLVFKWGEENLVQIANILGDIIDPDLFGVRLEDTDDDGQFEIVAGRGYFSEGSNCKIYEYGSPDPTESCWWHELDLREQVYRWDGETFVLEPTE